MSQLSDEEIFQEIGKIVGNFELLECFECATAVMRWLKANGVNGKVIRLKTRYKDEDYILSERLLDRGVNDSITINGRASVSDLFMFLVGYKTARRESGIELTEEEADFCENFHGFVERRYKLHTSKSWAKIIRLYCHHEKDGFENFFKLLDEFKGRDKCLDGDWFDEMASEDNTQTLEETKSSFAYLQRE